MNVLFVSPGFPEEMPRFVRGLARVGARVYGLGDAPAELFPDDVRRALAGYLRVDRLWDEGAVVAAVAEADRDWRLDRVECLWEPAMMLAAAIRERLELPGLDRAATIPFRDKESMKQVLDAAGLRTPRHARARGDRETREAAERVGFPLVVKPIDGAGAQNTYRVDDPAALDRVLPALAAVPERSVEEYVRGEEYTFDTIAAGGRVLYHNIAWYRPKPIVGRSVERISPQTITLRAADAARFEGGRALGRRALDALGFTDGFTHMEWFLTPDGEAVFGEIAARPPGARSVDLMNYGADIDTYTGWAEAVCHGTFSQRVERKYNAAAVFKRAIGEGRIARVEGLRELARAFGPSLVHVDLLPPGSRRRDWRQTLVSDGYVVVRHPELAVALEMASRVGSGVRILTA